LVVEMFPSHDQSTNQMPQPNKNATQINSKL